MRRKQWSIVLAATLGGCGLLPGGEPAAKPLGADAFVERRQVQGTGRVQPVDQSGPLVFDQQGDNSTDPIARPPAEASPEQQPIPKISDVPPKAKVPDDVKPTDQHDEATAGQYQLVGTVLAQVNGQPIFADAILRKLENPLAREARRLDADGFRAIARDLIEKQIEAAIDDELEFAAAQRTLEARYEERARALAMEWRKQEITKAGGSEKLARRKWAAEGWDFDERVEEEYREIMRRMLIALKERPFVQVGQRDIRAYYEANKQKEFTRQASANFRVIKIGIGPNSLAPTREEAIKLANDLKKRASAGEDFDKLAARHNDSQTFKKPFEKPIDKGAFAIEAIEDAVWKLEPGQISDVIETKGPGGNTDAVYIVKLTEKKAGQVIAFEEAQDAIRRKLTIDQLAVARSRTLQGFRREAVLWRDKERTQVALDMAMQRYPHWNRSPEKPVEQP